MRDQKLQLPDFLIADLYKQSLVEIAAPQLPGNDKIPQETESAPDLPEKDGKLSFLGENKKHVIVLVDHPQTTYLEDGELQFLTNILKACSLSLADIAILNVAKQEIIFTELKTQLGAVHILLFDVEPTVIKVPFVTPHFQVQQFDNTSIVYLPSLQEMNLPTEESIQMKRNLWASLKKVFGI